MNQVKELWECFPPGKRERMVSTESGCGATQPEQSKQGDGDGKWWWTAWPPSKGPTAVLPYMAKGTLQMGSIEGHWGEGFGLYYPGEPSVIIGSLKVEEEGRKEGQKHTMGKSQPTGAGVEVTGTKGSRRFPEAGKGKEPEPPQSLQKGTQPWLPSETHVIHKTCRTTNNRFVLL